MESSQVCVVGSGPTGVCAIKYCLEYGLSVICYDDRPRLGGIWLGADPSFCTKSGDGSIFTIVHDELRLNTSQFTTTYSDYPLPDDLTPSLLTGERFQNAAQFLEYLTSYAQHFGVDKHVQSSTEVIDVRKKEDSYAQNYQWEVTTRTKIDGSFVLHKSRHRYVIIASGFYKEPDVPQIPGMDKSAMEIIHSGHCRAPSQLFRGRRVLVVGGSLSAGDMVDAALKVGAEKVTWVLTRNPSGRSILSLERYPFGRKFAWDEWMTVFSALFTPDVIRRRIIGRMFTFIHRRSYNAPINFENDRIVFGDCFLHDIFKSKNILSILHCTVSQFESGLSVWLTNGDRMEADVCVLATGYRPSYSFLSKEILGEGGLASLAFYRHCIVTNTALWGLSFLYTTSFAGGGIACEEMEARWLIHHLANGILEGEEARTRLFKGPNISYTLKEIRKRVTVDMIIQAARDLGCMPSVWPAIFSLSPWKRRTALAVAFGPLISQQFRLCGPNPRPEMAEVVQKVARSVMGWKFEAVAFLVDVLQLIVITAIVGSTCRIFIR